MRPMTLPSASVREAISLPPPISFTSCLGIAPASRSANQALPDVVDVPLAHGPCHALAVSIGIQADILVLNLEADVIGLVHRRLRPGAEASWPWRYPSQGR